MIPAYFTENYQWVNSAFILRSGVYYENKKTNIDLIISFFHFHIDHYSLFSEIQ